jgi:hypothetical protein
MLYSRALSFHIRNIVICLPLHVFQSDIVLSKPLVSSSPDVCSTGVKSIENVS